MRILVISDIHANYIALEAVLADAGEVDAVWCLGDIVGYGPDPNACVERVRELPGLVCVLGNHDMAVLGKVPRSAFNREARHSLAWQERVLMASNMDFLRSLPHTLQERDGVSLVHGSPRDPVWEYVLNTLTARMNFPLFETPWCFVGHTHAQSIFRWNDRKHRVYLDIPRPGEPLALPERAILNPGSVGQPRDRDPRAAYAIYDPDAKTWEPRRVEYDIEAVQQRIREVGLPLKHALRLAEGW